MDGYVPKPVDKGELLKVCAQFAGGRPCADAPSARKA